MYHVLSLVWPLELIQPLALLTSLSLSKSERLRVSCDRILIDAVGDTDGSDEGDHC